MAPQPTAVDYAFSPGPRLRRTSLVGLTSVEPDWQELRKPLLATSCAADRKIRRSRRVLFTDGARSATINHNNLETCELPALILGTRRGGFESEFLLRARRGNEAGRRRSANCPSHAARTLAIHSPCSRGALFPAAPSHRRSPLDRQRLAPLIQGRKE